MDSQLLLTVRFPEGLTEFTLAAQTPNVGDTLKRGSDEWKVIAVEIDDGGENVVVALAPIDGDADGKPKQGTG